MEYDDRFNSLESNIFDDSNYNEQSALKRVNSLNRGYHTLSRNILDHNKNMKTVEIGVYSSGMHGSPIRNAETGEYYKYKVGTMDEDLFFKVGSATGVISSGPLTLFYDSPSQYEKHQYADLDNNSKRRWENKKNNRLDILHQLSKKVKK